MSLASGGMVAWWRDLQPDPDKKKPGDRAALARLRRCATVAEAMQEPAAIVLFRLGGGQGMDDLSAAGLAAAVLAHVREDDPGVAVARRIGPDGTGTPETALMKPLRFRRLLDAATPDERLTAFRRLVALAKDKVNVRDLAAALARWDEGRRTRWVYEYWNAGQPAAPHAEETTP